MVYLNLNSGLSYLRKPEECAVFSFSLRFLKHIYYHPKTTRLDISLLYIPASLDISLLMLRGDLEQTSIYDSLKSQRIRRGSGEVKDTNRKGYLTLHAVIMENPSRKW